LLQRQAAATQEIISGKTATRAAATTISQHANESSNQSNSIQILQRQRQQQRAKIMYVQVFARNFHIFFSASREL